MYVAFFSATTEDKGKLFHFLFLYWQDCELPVVQHAAAPCNMKDNENNTAFQLTMQKCYATKMAKVSEACIYLNLIQWATLWHKPESTRTSLRAHTNFTLPRIYLFCLPRQQPSQTAITNVFTVYFLATFVFTYQQKGDDTQIRGCRARNTSRHELTQDSINEHECRRQKNASISGFLRGEDSFWCYRGVAKKSSGRLKAQQESTRVQARSRSLVWQIIIECVHINSRAFSTHMYPLESLWVEENVSSIGENVIWHSSIFNESHVIKKTTLVHCISATVVYVRFGLHKLKHDSKT